MAQVRDFTELKSITTKYEESIVYLNRRAITLGIDTDALFARARQTIKLLQTRFRSRFKQGGDHLVSDQDLRFLFASHGVLAHTKRELDSLLTCAADHEAHRNIFDATVQEVPYRRPQLRLVGSSDSVTLPEDYLAFRAERDSVRRQCEKAFDEAQEALFMSDQRSFNQSLGIAKELAARERTLALLIAR